MGSHINWQDPEKPPIANFARVMCFVLGGAGLVIAGFVGITEDSLAAFLFLGLLFSLPIAMAFFARPRRWFIAHVNTDTTGPWWKRTADREYYLFGKMPFRELSLLDYVLLSIVLLSNIVLVPMLLPMLPGFGSMRGWFAPTCIIVAAPLLCAYLWQLKVSDRFPALNVCVLTAVAVMLYMMGLKMDDHDSMISGVLAAQIAIWTSLRLVISRCFARPEGSGGN